MFVQVRLLKGFSQPLLYQVPSDWQQQNLVGTLVRVPIRNRINSAFVIEQMLEKPPVKYAIKALHSIELFPSDPHYLPFIEQLATYYQLEAVHFIKRIRHFLTEKESEVSHTVEQTIEHAAVTLTHEQQACVDYLLPCIIEPSFKPTLLHGVTGSGKTEVYKRLIIETVQQKKVALLLLPEVTLALQFQQLMQAQLPSTITIFGFHSAISTAQKKLLWQTLMQNQPCLIIGVHLPILLPLPNLGLIIIDEEHDPGYQEKKHPKINTKEAALLRAKAHNIPILLGSATPSLATLHTVKTKGWSFFQLKRRFSGNFPQVRTVFLPDKKFRKSFWISKELELAIADRLEKKEQIIIFLNRRGFSFFVQCKQCSFIAQCSNCSVSLTLHEDNILTCHYCGMIQQVPSKCPTCSARAEDFLKKGIGTQQVVTILEQLFPHARIARADLDTTQKKKSWQQTLDDFSKEKLDILVGTQTITKGFHFPKVTLVGIIWADLNLHFPVYNAAETTLQQLIQVAGRAGRQSPNGQVVLQAMIDHPIFKYVNELEYLSFYQHELRTRQLLSYPPFIKLVELELKEKTEEIVESEAKKLMAFLLHHKSDTITILGPAKPAVHKIKNTHSRKIYIKSQTFSSIIALTKKIKRGQYKSSIFFTPNPQS